jgi:hypothetical protein
MLHPYIQTSKSVDLRVPTDLRIATNKSVSFPAQELQLELELFQS